MYECMRELKYIVTKSSVAWSIKLEHEQRKSDSNKKQLKFHSSPVT